MPQIAPPQCQGAAPPHAPSSAIPPLKPPPPASGAPAAKGSASPVVWIVALAVGVMGIGAMFVLLLIVGVASIFLFRGGPAAHPPVANPPAISSPNYASGSGDYGAGNFGAGGQPAGLSSVPPSSGDVPAGYSEPSRDPNWQLNLPEYQRDAIRELNQQREEREQREAVQQQRDDDR
jgi:hypothetical protein